MSPWYPEKGKREVYQLSQAEDNQPLYQLYKDRILINERWFDYLTKHVRIIRDYVYWNLSLFLQRRNPNVPDIPNKLIKPALRSSLLKQRKFWDVVIDANGPLRCIYTGKELYKGQYHVEHFIPYSFVSHNQIWNLIPSDNSFNISKSNKLPPLDKYFDSFYNMQRKDAIKIIENILTSSPNFFDEFLEASKMQEAESNNKISSDLLTKMVVWDTKAKVLSAKELQYIADFAYGLKTLNDFHEKNIRRYLSKLEDAGFIST